MESINDLNVSKKWKSRFQLIEELGGEEIHSPFELQKTAEFKALPLTKRLKVTHAFTPFIFSFLWYFSKGMWAKGFIIFAFSCLYYSALGIIESLASFQISPILYWVPVSAVCGSLGIFDYYRYKVKDERVWKGAFLGGLFSNKRSIAIFVFSTLSINICTSLYLEGFFSQTGNQTVVANQPVVPGNTKSNDEKKLLGDIVGTVWNSGDRTYSFMMNNDKLIIKENDDSYSSAIKNIDLNNGIVSAVIDGTNTLIIIRQNWNDNNESFNLSISINDATPIELGFIRNI